MLIKLNTMKKYLLLLLFIPLVFACSSDDATNEITDPEPNYLFVANNGITIKATSEAVVGQTYDLDGKSYLVIDESLFNEIAFDPNLDWSLTVLKDVQSMYCWFSDCQIASQIDFNQDISHWDTHTVKDMSGLFAGNQEFQQDVSNWDTSNVENMGGMFASSGFNSDISNWDTSSVTRMDAIFYNNNTFNGDISGWNTANVTRMDKAFIYSNISPNISDWNTENVTRMDEMFRESAGYAGSNMDISGWNTGNVTNMYFMFRNSGYTPDISNWDVGNVTNCTSFEASNSPIDYLPAFTNCD